MHRGLVLRSSWLFSLAILTAGALRSAAGPLSLEEVEDYLRTARVVKARTVGSGVTDSWRLTLDDSRTRHDASFQAVDEREARKDLGGGQIELDFVDSYRYNVAAYRLAALVGLEDMVPVSVPRSWRGRQGALTWWVDDVAMSEKEMNELGLTPPDGGEWSAQVYKVRVFTQLVHDTDRNQSNLLITKDWRIWMIDFTRAFRRWPELRSRDGLHRCDRELYRRLQSLTEDALRKALTDVLTPVELSAILPRRDLLIQHFDGLIRERGEDAVLY